ncbi:hypothetical protein GCM10023173_10140 [Sphingobacterium thermophilum]|uniref:Uncharacterized protein n=1 Tax=Sphingobacterium thermophilum TaxID=768534 RepID=A0ABP8QZF0_9SPHI
MKKLTKKNSIATKNINGLSLPIANTTEYTESPKKTIATNKAKIPDVGLTILSIIHFIIDIILIS